MIEQYQLKNWFDYNPETGQLVWKIRKGPYVSVGDEVGHTVESGHRRTSIDRKKYYVHRIIWKWMTGEWPEKEIDHINRIPDDNRWCNLRVVSRQQNQQNLSLFKNNTTGHAGVKRRKTRFRAYIHVNKQYISLGSYAEMAAAIAARQEAERKYFA